MSRHRSSLIKHRRAYNYCTNISTNNTEDSTTEKIASTDLLIHFDANDTDSYSGSGNTWINIGTGGTTYNALLINSPIFNNDSIKSFQFDKRYLDNATAYLSYNYMRFLRPIAISDNFTYCAWIKTSETGYGTNHFNFMYIISTETGNVNNDFGFGINSNGCLAYGDGSIGGSDITISSTRSVNTGTWTFVAVTRNKSTGEVILYVNGYEDTRGYCNAGNTLSTSTYVLIGSETDFPGYTFGGYIGAILGNTSVLTPSQILINYNATKSVYRI